MICHRRFSCWFSAPRVSSWMWISVSVVGHTLSAFPSDMRIINLSGKWLDKTKIKINIKLTREDQAIWRSCQECCYGNCMEEHHMVCLKNKTKSIFNLSLPD